MNREVIIEISFEKLMKLLEDEGLPNDTKIKHVFDNYDFRIPQERRPEADRILIYLESESFEKNEPHSEAPIWAFVKNNG